MSVNEQIANPKPSSTGLENVSIGTSCLSQVDGEAGTLIIGGYELESLVAWAGYSDVAHLLWSGQKGDAQTIELLNEQMAQGRVQAHASLGAIGTALALAHPMDALRTALSFWESPSSPSMEAYARICGAVGTYNAAWWRLKKGLDPVAPNPQLNMVEDFLRMLNGEAAHPESVRALSTYLVAVCDHGMNASTFTMRVIGSTASDLTSAAVGALGALKGPLHGGAPGPVLDMLDEITDPERAGVWIEGELARGQRIMGMGHRVYRVRDPRAHVLEQATLLLTEQRGDTARLGLARAVEQAATKILQARKPDRPIAANVEFYTAVLLEAIGIPRDLFTNVFALGRMIGWCAHYGEQRETGRLIRPKVDYIGPKIK